MSGPALAIKVFMHWDDSKRGDIQNAVLSSIKMIVWDVFYNIRRGCQDFSLVISWYDSKIGWFWSLCFFTISHFCRFFNQSNWIWYDNNDSCRHQNLIIVSCFGQIVICIEDWLRGLWFSWEGLKGGSLEDANVIDSQAPIYIWMC